MKKITPKVPFFLLKMNETTRMYVIGGGLGMYLLVLYEAFPEYLFDTNQAVIYAGLPTIIGLVGIMIPKFLSQSKGSKSQPQNTQATSENTSDIDALVAGAGDGGGSSDIDALVAGTGNESSEKKSDSVDIDAMIAEAQNSGEMPTAAIDEGLIDEKVNKRIDDVINLVEQKQESLIKDIELIKDRSNKLEKEIKITQEDIENLIETFEGPLRDIKSLQSDEDNPFADLSEENTQYVEPTPKVVVKQEPVVEPPKQSEPVVEPPKQPGPVVEPEPVVEPPKQPEPVVEPPKQPEPVVEPPKQPEPVVEPPKQPEPKKELAPFVDTTKDPQSYIDRYNNEPTYKAWFDANYPNYSSIYEAVGLPESKINKTMTEFEQATGESEKKQVKPIRSEN